MFLKFARNKYVSNLEGFGENSNLASIIPHVLRIWRPRSKRTHTKYTHHVVPQIPWKCCAQFVKMYFNPHNYVLSFAPQPLNCVLRWTYNFCLEKVCLCRKLKVLFFIPMECATHFTVLYPNAEIMYHPVISLCLIHTLMCQSICMTVPQTPLHCVENEYENSHKNNYIVSL
jgi:hypothetical protein